MSFLGSQTAEGKRKSSAGPGGCGRICSEGLDAFAWLSLVLAAPLSNRF